MKSYVVQRYSWNPLNYIKTIANNVWRRRSTWLPVLLMVYVISTLIISYREYEHLFGRKHFKHKNVNFAINSDPLLPSIPKNLISPMDLTLPVNKVNFKSINSRKKCFQFTEVSHLDERPKEDSSTFQRLRELLKSISKSTVNRIYGDEKDEEEERLNAKMNAEERLELYRDSIDVAVDRIQETAQVDSVSQCIFEGFTKNESAAMWWQAERRLRTRQCCDRYNSVLHTPDLHALRLSVHRLTGTRVCAPVQLGALNWHALVLDHIVGVEKRRGPETFESSAMDDPMLQSEVNFNMHPLEVDVTKEARWQRPLTVIAAMHPIMRLMIAYEYRIKAGFRKEDQVRWIKQFRGKNVSILLEELKAKFSEKLEKHDKVVLSKLFFVDHLEDSVTVAPNKALSDELSFREFVWVVVSDILLCTNDFECLKNVDALWRPQFVRCNPCSLPYDVLSKVEALIPDSAILEKLIGKKEINGEMFQQNIPFAKDELLYDPILKFNKSNTKTNDTSDDLNIIAEREQELLEFCEGNERIKNPAQDYFETKLNKFRSKTLDLLKEISAKEYKIIYVAYSFDYTLFGYTENELLLKCSANV